MKTLIGFLSVLLCVAPFGAADAVVSSTAGSNLTAYNGESGATNNNRWNTLMNSRSGGNDTAAVADFGNCNAIVMRCAQPKCSSGGCTDLNVTYAIVSGCVQSNEACKQYGNELTQYISAQLVAQSTARANDAANAASAAAAEAAAAQSAQQMAAMQAQMQQMQSEMAAQNAATVAQLQSALEEQKQMTANAIAEATAARETQTIAATPSTPAASNTTVATTATSDSGLTGAQLAAAQNGVSADILAREQISGQIMSSIENAEVQLKKLKATMNDAFSYAGCDSRGNNCTGPKRVKMFKQKAEDFFDPYEEVLDEMYDALILAQSVGVDINDIYMMLSGSCNMWGKYLCEKDQALRYTKTNCKNGTSESGVSVIGGAKCTVGKIIPVSDGGCQPLGKLDESEEIRYNWLWPEDGEESRIRVGCMSDVLDDSTLFRGRKKQATIDIETLQKIIAQDAPAVNRYKNGLGNAEQVKYCAVTATTYADLQKLVTLKSLPTKDICINERTLDRMLDYTLLINDDSIIAKAQADCDTNKGVWSSVMRRCYCEADAGKTECNAEKAKEEKEKAEQKLCEKTYNAVWKDGKCGCVSRWDIKEDEDACRMRFDGNYSKSSSYVPASTSSSAFKPNIDTVGYTKKTI